MTDPALTTLRVPSPSWLRRLGLLFAGVLVLVLLGSLAFHLQGRALYRDASNRFVSELGTEVPNLSPDAQLAQIAGFAPPPVAEAENAARWLVAGAQGLVWDRDEIRAVKDLARMPTSQWTTDQWVWVRDLVERNSGGLETLHRAVPLAGSHYGVAYDDILRSEIPNLIELMNAAHLVRLEGRLAFSEGEAEVGFEAIATLARLTESLRAETMLIFSLIGHVTEKLQLHGISEVLMSSEPWATSRETLVRLKRLMPSQDLLAFTRKIVALDAAVTAVAAIEGRDELWINASPSRLQVYYRGYRRAADYLDVGRERAALVYVPYASDKARFASPVVKPPHALGGAYRSAVTKGQLAMSLRRLVAGALELRRIGLDEGIYPETCEGLATLAVSDPFVDQPLACQRLGDGSFHLEIPGIKALIDEMDLPSKDWLTELTLSPVETATAG